MAVDLNEDLTELAHEAFADDDQFKTAGIKSVEVLEDLTLVIVAKRGTYRLKLGATVEEATARIEKPNETWGFLVRDPD